MTLPQTTTELLNRITDPYGVYCVLELRMSADKSIFHLFPVMPESLAIVQRYLQSITPTQGGVFVDEYGRAPSPTLLSGTFGRSPKLGLSAGQDALLKNADAFRVARAQLEQAASATNPLITTTASQTKSGQSLLSYTGEPTTGYKLVKLLSEMVELSHVVNPETGKLPQVFFYNFAFGQFYEVALTSFQAQMSVEQNTLWYYQLEMTLLKRINEGAIIDSMQAVALGAEPTKVYRRSQELAVQRLTETPVPEYSNRGTRSSTGLLSQKDRLRLQNALDTVQRGRQTISRVNGLVTSFRAIDAISYGASYLDKTLGLSPGTVLGFYDTVRQMPTIIKQVEGTIYQVTRRIPNDVLRELGAARTSVATIQPRLEQLIERVNVQQVAASTAPVRDVPTALYPPEMAPAMDLFETLQTVQDVLDGVDTLIDMYGLTEAPATSESVVFSTPPVQSLGPGSTNYIIRQGDTLIDIARRQYGDETAWTMVAARLPAPYSGLASTEPLDALMGTVIQLPAINTGATPLVPYVWNEPVGAEALGRDLPDTLTTTLRSDGTYELSVLSPYETLLQGLLHRLQTPIGSIPDDAEFGSAIPALVGQEFGVLSDGMNQMKIAEAIRKDPRLTSVTNVTARQNQGTLEIGFAATARNAGSLGYVDLTLSRQTP